MCHAIITVKYKSTGTADLDTIKVENQQELEVWDKRLQDNEEVLSYRVYKYEYGRSRVSMWSTHVTDLANLPK